MDGINHPGNLLFVFINHHNAMFPWVVLEMISLLFHLVYYFINPLIGLMVMGIVYRIDLPVPRIDSHVRSDLPAAF